MLKLDLGQLERHRRVRLDVQVPPGDPMWEGVEARFTGPVAVRLEAQQAGPDVVVRGTARGEVELACRRCLETVRVPVEEDFAALYRQGVSPAEALDEDVYPLPTRSRELDLTEAVREHFLLAVPNLTVCREACRGLCPRCGTNLNERTCDCEAEERDDRWAALRKLKFD